LKIQKEVKSMETTLTILMALGIYVVAPLLIAAAVCGIAVLRAGKARARVETKIHGAARQPAKT
jgi:Na+/H+-dicarboxylate symporter